MAPKLPAIIAAVLTSAVSLAFPSPLTRAAETDTDIRFDTPSFYCEITDASPAETDLMTRVRRHGEPNMIMIGLFADCEQKLHWNGDPAKEPTRFGAAFLHKSKDGVRPVPGTRTEVLQKLASRLSSWDQAPSRLAFEQMTKGALDMKVERAQIMAATPTAVFIGFTAVTPSDNGGERTVAGISAISLIKQLPVSLHLYRNRTNDRTVHALLPEAMTIMHKWLDLNEDADTGSPSVASRDESAPPVARDSDHSLPELKPATNPERDDLMALLQRGEYETLSRRLADKQAAFESGQLSESLLFNAYLTFERADPNLMKKLDAWIDAQPSDYVPRVARGLYNTHLGWIARGTAYFQKTANDRVALMAMHFEDAAADFDAALTRNPKLSIAWRNLIINSVAQGHPAAEFYDRGIEQVPSSLMLRDAYAFSFHPKWGGGLEQAWWMRRMPGAGRVMVANRNVRWLKFHESLQTDATKIPTLRSVVASPHYQAAKQAFGKLDYGTAAQELTSAIRDGDESYAFVAKGYQQVAEYDYAAAVQSFDQALREGPEWTDRLKNRANALRHLGYATRNLETYRLTLTDYQKLLTINPYDPELLGDIVMVLWDLSTLFPNEAATAFEQMWQDPASCKPYSEPAKRFTVVRMATQDTHQMTINCTVEALLDRGILYGRDDFNIRELRGRHYLFAMQSPSRAVEDLAATIEIDDSFPQVWGHYATALHEIGDCRAMAAYRQYLDMCKDGKCPVQSVAISRNQFAELTLSGTCGD